MNTLPDDLLTLIIPKIDAIESILLLLATNNNLFNVTIEISLKEIIEINEYRLIRHHMKTEKSLLKMVKYLSILNRTEDSIIDMLVDCYESVLGKVACVGDLFYIAYIKGAIISNNHKIFNDYIDCFNVGIPGFFAKVFSIVLKDAIKYKRFTMIQKCFNVNDYIDQELEFVPPPRPWDFEIIMAAKYDGDTKLLDYIINKTDFNDWNYGAEMMAWNQDTVCMRYFINKGATNIKECTDILEYLKNNS